ILVSLALLLSSFQAARMVRMPLGLSGDTFGSSAPDFRAMSIDGTEYRLNSFRGRYVLLDFWAVGCPPCRDAMPALEAIHPDYKDLGLVILGIDIGDERLQVQTFLKSTPASYPILLDTNLDVANLYHADVIPTFLLIAPDGKIVDGQMGFAKADADSQLSI